MTDPSRGATRAVVLAISLILLAGCGAVTSPRTPVPAISATTGPATTAPTTTGPATTGPATTTARPDATGEVTPSHRGDPKSESTVDAEPVRLFPWPTTDQNRLQATADGGGQPWLLDPADLALSYVTATYKWSAAEATPAAGGTAKATTVAVRNTDGSARRLTVAQPKRTGAGGIWVVTADVKG